MRIYFTFSEYNVLYKLFLIRKFLLLDRNYLLFQIYTINFVNEFLSCIFNFFLIEGLEYGTKRWVTIIYLKIKPITFKTDFVY